jgi:hypothetical protein
MLTWTLLGTDPREKCLMIVTGFYEILASHLNIYIQFIDLEKITGCNRAPSK